MATKKCERSKIWIEINELKKMEIIFINANTIDDKLEILTKELKFLNEQKEKLKTAKNPKLDYVSYQSESNGSAWWWG
tara:strand:- start:34 stop:267 length:234 start_codon:yes stop_codon:yes gene_type:complete